MFRLFDVKKKAHPLSLNLAVDDSAKFQIYNNYEPILSRGEYTLTIAQSLTLDDDSTPQLKETKRLFKVEGPRFCLEQNDIHGFFPPPNSSGQFSTCLPHILFNKVALPWEINLQTDREVRLPWLTLLCLDQEEYSKCELSSMKVGEWIEKSKSGGDEIYYPELKSTSDEEKELNCQFLKIDKEIFFNITPNLCELPYLSHVRQVETTNRENLNVQDPGIFSILFSNRFPLTRSNCEISNKVFLISLEGIIESFKEDKRTNIKQKYISLITLTNWSFVCLKEPKENFANLVKSILEEQGSNTKFLTLPCLSNKNENSEDNNEQAKELNQLFDKGYVPLEHCLRTAENTFSWYHGPLITASMLLDDDSKDKILKQDGRYSYIYHEEQSVFDVSYVTAWELGRLLAMSDSSFVDNLMQLRIEYYKQTQNLVMKNILQSKLYSSVDNQANSTALFYKAEMSKKEVLSSFAGQIERVHISIEFNKLLEKIPINQNPTEQLQTVNRLSRPDEDPLQKSYKRKIELIKEHKDKSVLMEDNLLLKNLVSWVYAKRLLINIPFQYLVVDQKLLPNNSIRFFYIDPIWIKKMEEGFFSIGLHQKEDIANDKIKSAIQKILEPDQENKIIFGFLLRSSLVSGWPGLIIETTNGVTTLRQERLSDNVLICLFDERPESIVIKEPEEHMCFGVEGEHIDYAKIQLRCVTNGNSHKIGEKNGIELDVANYFRQNSPNLRVLSIENEDVANQSSSALLIPAFKEKLQREQISAGEFSLQLIKTPQECKLSLKLKEHC